MKTTTTPGAQLARLRWAKPGADRDQPRRAGRLGGRPATCDCGECAKCKSRETMRNWRAAKATTHKT